METSEKTLCDHPQCGAAGEYRAPQNRQQAHDKHRRNWFCFCLRHVQEYNARWNYYEGMGCEEIEWERKADVTWKRPTWSFAHAVSNGTSRGGKDRSFASAHSAQVHNGSSFFSFEDPFGFFADGEEAFATRTAFSSANSELEKALERFDLKLPFNQEELQARYRALVKRHHPDANGGSKEAENEFKTITETYLFLKQRAV